MAGFSEVVRQFRRMCKDGCAECPLMKEQDDCWDYAKKHPAVFERRVMDWAEAHPWTKYPTWAEWLRDMNIHGMDTIPADIAEKLGIKPKGV